MKSRQSRKSKKSMKSRESWEFRKSRKSRKKRKVETVFKTKNRKSMTNWIFLKITKNMFSPKNYFLPWIYFRKTRITPNLVFNQPRFKIVKLLWVAYTLSLLAKSLSFIYPKYIDTLCCKYI